MTAETLIPGTHSVFAPSSGYRIAICGASLHATEGLPDTSTFEAVEGTVAHEIHERCMKEELLAEEFIGNVYQIDENQRHFTIPVDEDMARYVQESVDWCLELNGEHFVEERVNIDPWTPIPNQSGTCDHACIYVDDFGLVVLVITDLKYGKGVKIFAHRNIQLALYALGFLNHYDWLYNFDRIEIRVSQPRLDHRDVWEVTKEALYEFGAWIKQRFEIAWNPGAPFVPDEHACMFCKIRSTCAANVEVMHKLAAGLFDEMDDEILSPTVPDTWPDEMPRITTMTPEQIGIVLGKRDLIRRFLDSLERYALVETSRGNEIPEWKSVEGSSRRKWTDEKAAVRYAIGHKVALNKLIVTKTNSPAKVEKLLPKEARAGLKDFILKPAGRPTLVKASDPRPAYTLSADAIFDDESEEEDF